MEKAILKTLNYKDFSRFPMKAYEIHKWLIGKKATLFQVEKALEKLLEKRKIQNLNDYYFLPKRKHLTQKIDKQSPSSLITVRILTLVLRVIPRVKLIGISGGNNKLIIFVEDKGLAKSYRKNLETAFEILNMRLIWQRGNTYFQYLMENQWAFKFLPNWTTKD